MNSGNGNVAEYTVQRKAQGKYMGYKIACILMYAAIVFAYLAVVTTLGTSSIVISIAVVPFVPLLILVLRHLVWNRYVNVEYRYEIASANITFFEVYGKQKQKQLYVRRISEFELIAPVTAEFKDKYEGADTVHEFRGNAASPDAYFMMATEQDGKKTVVFFEAAEKTLKAIRYYNSKALNDSVKTSH